MTNRTYPYPRGVSLVDGGANVAVYTENADSVEFCRFDAEGHEHRTTLSERTGHTFHGFVPDVTVGTRYGLRVHGPWDPEAGLRFNANKLLLDPYATAIEGTYDWGENQKLFGHDMNDPEQQDHSDSADAMPRCVVTDPNSFDWGDDRTAADAAGRDGDLRDPRQGVHPAQERSRGVAARHLRRAGPAGGHRIPELARRDLGRVAAMPPVRPGLPPAGKGSAELLGLQLHRLPGPAQRVQRRRPGRPAGGRVQVDGQGAARRRARSDHGRGLQPHRRRKPDGPDARH